MLGPQSSSLIGVTDGVCRPIVFTVKGPGGWMGNVKPETSLPVEIQDSGNDKPNLENCITLNQISMAQLIDFFLFYNYVCVKDRCPLYVCMFPRTYSFPPRMFVFRILNI